MSVNIPPQIATNKPVSTQNIKNNADKTAVPNPVANAQKVQGINTDVPLAYPRLVIIQSNIQPPNGSLQQDMAAKVGEVLCVTAEKLSDFGENSEVEAKAMGFAKTKLSQSKGLVVGDANHACDLTPNFLARNMEDLKSSKVKQIYLEYFRSENQPALDRYFEKGDNLSELGEILVKQSPCGCLNPLPLVQKARENGVKCFGINSKGTPIERNKSWSEIVVKNSQKLDEGEKYLLMCGSGHLQGGMNFDFNGGSSIEELLQVPALRTSDTIIRANSDKIFEFNKFQQINDNYAQLVFPETTKN